MPASGSSPTDILSLQQFSGLRQVQQQLIGLNTDTNKTTAGRLLEQIFINPPSETKSPTTQVYTPRLQQQVPQISPLAIAAFLRQRSLTQQQKQPSSHQVVSPPHLHVTHRRVSF